MTGPADGSGSGYRAHDAHVHIVPRAVDPAGGEQAYLDVRDAHGIGIAAVVTPSTMGWDNETSFAVAAKAPERFRVIVRADLHAVDAAGRLRALLARGASGIRLTLLGEEDISWLTDGSLDEPLTVLSDAESVVEMHAAPDQLPAVGDFASRWPGAKVLIDHLGRPDVSSDKTSKEFASFLSLAAHPNVSAKTPNSSFFSRAGAPFEDLLPFYESALEAYGAERLLWASDWPLCTRDVAFEAAFDPLTAVLGGRTGHEADLIWRENFTRIFTGIVDHV